MFIFVVDLDIVDAGELLHRLGQRLGNVVGGAVRTAIAGQIDVEHAVGKFDSPVTDKSVPDCHQALGLLLRVGSLEVLVQS